MQMEGPPGTGSAARGEPRTQASHARRHRREAPPARLLSAAGVSVDASTTRTVSTRAPWRDASTATRAFSDRDGGGAKSFAERATTRDECRVVVTNPATVHVGVLPNHARWDRFLRGLRYVVVDEAHAYSGVFGSHVALILRRLRRCCSETYGSSPRFIVRSATAANPLEHARDLI